MEYSKNRNHIEQINRTDYINNRVIENISSKPQLVKMYKRDTNANNSNFQYLQNESISKKGAYLKCDYENSQKTNGLYYNTKPSTVSIEEKTLNNQYLDANLNYIHNKTHIYFENPSNSKIVNKSGGSDSSDTYIENYTNNKNIFSKKTDISYRDEFHNQIPQSGNKSTVYNYSCREDSSATICPIPNSTSTTNSLNRGNPTKVFYNSSKINKNTLSLLNQRVDRNIIRTVALHTATIIHCPKGPAVLENDGFFKINRKDKSKMMVNDDNICNSGLVSLETFITWLVEKSKVNMGTLVCSLIYLNKLKHYLPKGSQGQECTLHRIFLASLILAGKYLNDSSPKNKYWARYSRIFSLSEVNLMEKQFLDFLKFDLKINTENLNEISTVFYKTEPQSWLSNINTNSMNVSTNSVHGEGSLNKKNSTSTLDKLALRAMRFSKLTLRFRQ
ncbi:hypothetical protein BB559_006527 [Furculomyces boomerangus]|uniref:Cyclin N-terminal domain-containing protein n=1 Tax=Furculomyces boomerangus TaxID=61424 RepID=A0A2T9Y242_9FUNG|nr:hypothetical protein BB559_006527 [Furculomyces boomerangus]